MSSVAGRAGSSSPPHPSRSRSPAARCTPGIRSGRPPARRGTRGSDTERAGLQGHTGGSCPEPRPPDPRAQGELSCTHRVPRTHGSNAQSCASSPPPGYPNAQATSPMGTTPSQGLEPPAVLGGGSLHTGPFPSAQTRLLSRPAPCWRPASCPQVGHEGGHAARCSQPASSLPSVQSASPSHRQALGMHSWPREQPHCWSRHSPSSLGQPCRSRGASGATSPLGVGAGGSPPHAHLLIRAVLAVGGPVAAPGLRHALPAVGTRHLARAAQQGPRHGTALLVRSVPAVSVPIAAQGHGHALPAAAGELGWAALLGRCEGRRG